MSKSSTKKRITNMVYGLGAAVVIVGALFKIQHLSIGPITGGLMLTVGLLVEAGIFIMSAFEAPEEELDWARVYPELADDGAVSERRQNEDGLLSEKLDNLLAEAKIDAGLMEKLGKSIHNFQGAAEGLSGVSESISATNKYNEQMAEAATQMESLNSIYKLQLENSNQQAELNNAVVENAQALKEQMDSLAKNLSSLNGVYGGMLSAMSKN